MEQFTLDHIGYAVRSIDASLDFYRQSMGLELHSREVISGQEVEVAFLKLPNTMIELLAPTGPTSTLSKFLEKRGPGFHHVCYRVDDIRKALNHFSTLGFDLIDKTPRPGAHGSQIAFIHPKSFEGVLTELCEYPKNHSF